VGLDEAAALQRLTQGIPPLLRWLKMFMSPSPRNDALVDVGYGAGGPPQQRICIQVRVVHEHDQG
jgi:hypothetical protein